MHVNCSLSTRSHEHELPTGGKIASVFVLVCLTVGTIFGNALVIRAVCKFSSLRTAANTILISLSVAAGFADGNSVHIARRHDPWTKKFLP